MKRVFLLVLVLGVGCVGLNAQWGGSSDINGTIYRNGNVGIGTDNPISLLDVSNKSGDATLSISSALGTTGNSTLQFGTSSAWKIRAYSYSNGDKYSFGILYDRDDVCGDFYVKNYNKTNLIIKANGFTGIGTESPGSLLDVSNKSGDATLSISSALGTTGNSTLQFGTSSAWKIRAYSYSNGDKYDFGILYDRDDVCGDFYVKNYNKTNLIIKANGNIGIGTTTPTNKLEVAGTIRAEEIRVETGWADFVFEKDYNLRPLQEVNTYIQQNGHLPEIPTAKEVEENGISLGEMNAKLLQKIEELTLYTIEQQREIEELKKQNLEIEQLKQQVEILLNKL